MADLLQLTPEQESRFREIMSESRKQLDHLRLEEAPKLEALRAEEAPRLDAIRAETNRKLKAILNQEQQNKFESSLKEMENRTRRGPGGRQFGPPMRPMQPPDGNK
jgi:Spy/CpxP family protein refolding chaperone